MNQPEEQSWAVLMEGGVGRLREVAEVLAHAEIPCQVVPPPPERASP